MAGKSNSPLALATRNVYGHMYCDALTSHDGNPQNSAKIMDSRLASAFHIEHLEMMNGERPLELGVMVSE